MRARTERIVSKNAAWQKFEVLKTNRNKRYRYRQFFVEGVRNINEAIRCGWTIDAWIYSFEKHLSDWARDLLNRVPVSVQYALPAALMAELSEKTDASELCAVVRMRDDARLADQMESWKERPLLLLFDRPSNKGNLGTLIRSCDGLGVDQLVVTGHGVDRYDPEVIAASTGSFFRQPVLYLADNSTMDDWIGRVLGRWPDLQLIGTTAHREHPIDQVDLKRPTLFLLGNETDGLSRALRERCTLMTTIPMNPESAASSFNVSCAATVLLYEACRQRRNAQDK